MRKIDLEVKVNLELQSNWLLGEEYLGNQNYKFVTWRWKGNDNGIL